MIGYQWYQLTQNWWFREQKHSLEFWALLVNRKQNRNEKNTNFNRFVSEVLSFRQFFTYFPPCNWLTHGSILWVNERLLLNCCYLELLNKARLASCIADCLYCLSVQHHNRWLRTTCLFGAMEWLLKLVFITKGCHWTRPFIVKHTTPPYACILRIVIFRQKTSLPLKQVDGLCIVEWRHSAKGSKWISNLSSQ